MSVMFRALSEAFGPLATLVVVDQVPLTPFHRLSPLLKSALNVIFIELVSMLRPKS